MGNQLAQPTKLQPEHLAELDDVVLKTMLGEPYVVEHAVQPYISTDSSHVFPGTAPPPS